MCERERLKERERREGERKDRDTRWFEPAPLGDKMLRDLGNPGERFLTHQPPQGVWPSVSFPVEPSPSQGAVI